MSTFGASSGSGSLIDRLKTQRTGGGGGQVASAGVGGSGGGVVGSLATQRTAQLTSIERLFKQFGTSAKRDIRDQTKQLQASSEQDLISRGLSQTTISGGRLGSIARQGRREESRISERVAQNLAGFRTGQLVSPGLITSSIERAAAAPSAESFAPGAPGGGGAGGVARPTFVVRAPTSSGSLAERLRTKLGGNRKTTTTASGSGARIIRGPGPGGGGGTTGGAAAGGGGAQRIFRNPAPPSGGGTAAPPPGAAPPSAAPPTTAPPTGGGPPAGPEAGGTNNADLIKSLRFKISTAGGSLGLAKRKGNEGRVTSLKSVLRSLQTQLKAALGDFSPI